MTKLLDTTDFFSRDDLKSIDPNKLPRHIAIIPDGNRRWAKSRFLPALQGHVAGAETSLRIVQAAKELGIKAVTLYSFSTENWKRPTEEVEHLLKTITDYLGRYQNKLVQNGVRFTVLGRRDGLGPTLTNILDKTCQMTAHATDFELQLAINYGGRDELCRAVQKICASGIAPEAITEEIISRNLDTNGLVDPDLIIRTSGEMRLSNFLLWQSSYSELYCSSTSWPDFTPRDLLDAVKAYQMRVRRIGGSAL